MKFWSAISMCSALVLPVTATAGLPNNPRPDFVYIVPEYGYSCTPTHITWQSNYAYDRDNMEIRADSNFGDKPVSIVCATAHHKVRIVLSKTSGYSGHCDASTDANLDIYVDGRKVLENASWGEWRACQQNVKISPDEITRVIINDRMHLTVCRDTNEHHSSCSLTDLNERRH